jgi:biopolymer transport protein ExbD
VVPVVLLVTDKELRLSAGGTPFDALPFVRDAQGKLELAKLKGQLKVLKSQLPEQSAVTLQAEDAVRYEDLVRIIDECIGSGLESVSVAAAAS